MCRRARGSASKASPAKAASRCTKRDSTIGVPSRFLRAAEDDAPVAHRHDEIMRRLANAPLRRRQAQRLRASAG